MVGLDGAVDIAAILVGEPHLKIGFNQSRLQFDRLGKMRQCLVEISAYPVYRAEGNERFRVGLVERQAALKRLLRFFNLADFDLLLGEIIENRGVFRVGLSKLL